jgi:predicted cobalt transporter CbtA
MPEQSGAKRLFSSPITWGIAGLALMLLVPMGLRKKIAGATPATLTELPDDKTAAGKQFVDMVFDEHG